MCMSEMRMKHFLLQYRPDPFTYAQHNYKDLSAIVRRRPDVDRAAGGTYRRPVTRHAIRFAPPPRHALPHDVSLRRRAVLDVRTPKSSLYLVLGHHRFAADHKRDLVPIGHCPHGGKQGVL